MFQAPVAQLDRVSASEDGSDRSQYPYRSLFILISPGPKASPAGPFSRVNDFLGYAGIGEV